MTLCDHCGERAATCRGQYEAMPAPANACDHCCGHACEDGRCAELPQAATVRALGLADEPSETIHVTTPAVRP